MMYVVPELTGRFLLLLSTWLPNASACSRVSKYVCICMRGYVCVCACMSECLPMYARVHVCYGIQFQDWRQFKLPLMGIHTHTHIITYSVRHTPELQNNCINSRKPPIRFRFGFHYCNECPAEHSFVHCVCVCVWKCERAHKYKNSTICVCACAREYLLCCLELRLVCSLCISGLPLTHTPHMRYDNLYMTCVKCEVSGDEIALQTKRACVRVCVCNHGISVGYMLLYKLGKSLLLSQK